MWEAGVTLPALGDCSRPERGSTEPTTPRARNDWARVDGGERSNKTLIEGALRMLRTYLGLDVAFVSQLTAGLRVFRYVDAADETVINVGDADPAPDSYCHYVVQGELPSFLHDPSGHPTAHALPATRELPVGTHFSVPLVFSDGSTYGTFCGFSHQVVDELGERDLEVVNLLASMVADYVEQAQVEHNQREQLRDQLLSLEPGYDLQVVLQPIRHLESGRDIGFEALVRFPKLGEGPSEVFAAAWQLGVGIEVELAAVSAALQLLDQVPEPAYLAVNLAPDTLVEERLAELLYSSQPERLVLEITEHAPVADYARLLNRVEHLSSLGARLAIDDVGTGFSGLDHILQLEPSILKLDGALVRDIHQRPAKRAMIAALSTFARNVGITVIAEQLESTEERNTLRELGIVYAQGYLLARPDRPDELFGQSFIAGTEYSS